MRGRQRLLPDRLGRQRPRDRAPRAELLRRPLRPVRSRSTRRSSRRRRAVPKDQVPVSRPNFVDLCKRLVADDEVAFEALFRTLGLSVDWTYLYTTIGDHCVRTSQQAFLANLDRGEAYQQDAPTLWDVDFRTAVAQAELVDKEIAGAYHKIAFQRADGGDAVVDRHHAARSCSRRAARWSPIPTTRGTSRCSARPS